MPGDDMSDREEPDRPFNELAETAQQEEPVRSYQGPLDFPEVSSWLQQCQDNIERGRDKHEYTKLSPVFKEHECTRIDDITHMSVGEIRTLAAEMGVSVSLGLVNRVFQYASADVAMVKLKGKVA